MASLQGKSAISRIWYFLRQRILIVKTFDLLLQGALLLIILLESNVLLLLRRDAGTGHLPSRMEDWLIIGAAIAEFAFGTVLGWLGRVRRPLAVAGCLACSAVFALLVLAFPYKQIATPIVELCHGDPISAYTDAFPVELTDVDDDYDYMAPYRITLLIISLVLCSFTMVSIWAHGLTYLDDHAPDNGPYFYGILISIRLSLGLSARNWLMPGALRDDWWVAHLCISLLVFGVGFLLCLYPKKMPTWKSIDNPNENTGFFASFLRIMSNKVLNVQIVAMAFINTALFNFLDFDNAYVQARFHIEAVYNDPRTSRAVSDLFRALVVIFFILIFRVRFSNRRSDGVKSNTAAKVGGVVAVFVALLFGAIAILHCPIGTIAGTEGGSWLRPQCSWECGCKSENYGFTPVCVVETGITHFSACNAGCYEYEDLNGLLLFHNCTCSPTATQHVVRGSCTINDCRVAYSAYIILYTVTIAVAGASMLMQGMAIFRLVQRLDKPIAVAMAFSTVTLLANVPGRLLYMIISHLTCGYNADNGTKCVLHRSNIWWAPVTSAVLTLCSAVISIIASKMKRDSDTMDFLENRSLDNYN